MITLNQIRNKIISNPNDVKSILITQFQVDILKFINKYGFTTSKHLSLHSDEFLFNRNISIASASKQLLELFEKGYLTRVLNHNKIKGSCNKYYIAKGIKINE